MLISSKTFGLTYQKGQRLQLDLEMWDDLVIKVIFARLKPEFFRWIRDQYVIQIEKNKG